jgi:hypothetical protein
LPFFISFHRNLHPVPQTFNSTPSRPVFKPSNLPLRKIVSGFICVNLRQSVVDNLFRPAYV